MRRILAVCRRVQKSQNGGLELNYKKRTEKRDSITGGGGSYMEDVVSRYPLRISLTAISNAVKFLNCISLWSEGGARGQMRKPGASRSN